MAAPFGTEEYRFRVYGISGRDHTNKGTDPVLTDKGVSETSIPVRYIADSPPVAYEPGTPDDVKIEVGYQNKVVPDGIQNPVLGLYSTTYSTTNSTLDTNFALATDDIIQGRKPISALDGAIKAWRSGGGDKIRSEYEDALQKQGGS